MKRQWLTFLVLAAVAVWAWWSTLVTMANQWSRDPQYSHGYVIPMLACGLLWYRRDRLQFSRATGSWWGLLALAMALGLRWAGARFYVDWLDAISLLPCLAGICLVSFGTQVFRWALPVIAFLIFMIPLPYRIETAIQYPLRRLGTIGGVYAMQTMGIQAVAHGNVISIGDVQLGVAEACSGLSMLMVFLALTAAAAMISRRPLWERIVVFASGIPIAIASNVARISVTGALFASQKSEMARFVFHDVAGWLMMPLAFALLCAELWLLSRLIIIEEKIPLKFGMK
jgi:exosortase